MDRLQAMTAFVRVVETGSFSQAARQIGVGQPAISKTIAQLEDRLQVRLLIRSTHGLSPTDAGLRFFERARNAIQEADEAELDAKGAGAGLSGRLRICAATTFARIMVLPHLQHFMDTHPDLDVDVILDDRVIDLVSEGIDVALRMGELADSSAVARKLATGRRSVIVTPAYLERHGIPVVPADLSAHQAIVYTQLGNSWTFSREGTQASVSVSGKARFSAAEGIRAAVLSHMGLAVASDWMFAPELADGTVKRVLEDWQLPPIDLWAVFPTGKLASAKARAFAEFAELIVAAQSM
ncbi:MULTISPECIES: LysR family transcriptional regulator [Rhizobium]|uniref:HTH-type transcriptional regulator TtuA n=1 Tax=Rhizobium tropici TaxID=398 RepID=A0A329YE91_RHITR|nr:MULTISPECIES: LysR family transcriptional regulator [Rhizobium]MDK4723646.1 LysR family transcriptional regulator [Rhizobium sp. CNPSo 3968]RAX40414.1 LysR family transcriptional regulator [Rhizobium tropici]